MFKLLPHQVKLLEKCVAFEQGDVVYPNETINTRIGIIGEKAGAGKSFVMLSLARSKCPKIDMYKYFADNFFSIKYNTEKKEDKLGPNIFVVHHSLMRQWKDHIDLFDVKLKVLFVGRKCDIDKQDAKSLQNYEIIVLSSSVYGHFCTTFALVCFKRMFIDEADTILLSSQVVHALFYWFVTSSYKNILNPHGKLVFNNELDRHVLVAQGIKNNGFVRLFFMYLQSEFLEYILVKNDDSEVDQSCKMLSIDTKVIECLPPFSLCKKKISIDNIERVNHNDCPICYEKINEKGVLLCCTNIFCVTCITKWLSHTHKCPICRAVRTIEDVRILESSSSPLEPCIDTKNTQLVNFYNLILDPSVKNMLIFSEYDYIFNAIIPHLILQNISYSLLKGTGSRYEKLLDQYNCDTSRSALFLDADYYGCGLNLDATTDVIFFNKFDNEIEKKIIGSAQRIGRKTPLRVWHFIHKHETGYYFNGACH